MKTLMCGVILLEAFLTPGAIAQRGGPPAGGAGGFRGSGNHGGGQSQHFDGFAGHHPGAFGWRRGAFSTGGWAGWGYPALYSDYGQWGCCDNPYPQMVIMVVAQQPPPAPEPPAPPPEPPRPSIQGYNWPASADNSPGAFSIVRMDGTVRSAIAVWVQDGVVHHTGPNGATDHTPLEAIDREATQHLNAANELTLWLPADSSARQAQAAAGSNIRLAQAAPGGK